MNMTELQEMIDNFNKERGWTSYHNHRDLVLSIMEEIGELAKIVAWQEKPTADAISKMRGELADIFIYLASLANLLNINLGECTVEKLKKNQKRFPLLNQDH